MSDFLAAAGTIAAGVLGLAIIAVLVSKNAKTSEVIQAAASGYGNILAVALSPVQTGITPNLTYPAFGTTSA
jgi:hypothetical protein